MGSLITRQSTHLWELDEPDCSKPSIYDPHFGFEEPRKKRVILPTVEEMDSAQIVGFDRDYCVHLRMQAHSCLTHNNPFIWKCKGLMEEVNDCYYEDRIIAMKEFERERRLNARERRIREQAISA